MTRATIPSDAMAPARHHLIIADRTLASPELDRVITRYRARGPARFHLLVPQHRRSVLVADPAVEGPPTDRRGAGGGSELRVDERAHHQAEARLECFLRTYAYLGPAFTGEVGYGSVMAATRRIMSTTRIDEIIVSSPPSSLSRLRLDPPARLRRAFAVPVTAIAPVTEPLPVLA